MRVYRDMRQAEDAQLAGLRNTAAELLDSYERFLGGDMVEGLCLLREAVVREQERRVAPDNPEDTTASSGSVVTQTAVSTA